MVRIDKIANQVDKKWKSWNPENDYMSIYVGSVPYIVGVMIMFPLEIMYTVTPPILAPVCLKWQSTSMFY